MWNLTRTLILAAAVLITEPRWAQAQQPISPVDFRPFSDGEHWIVKEPLIYIIGSSQDSVTVPVGFVTDMASIPPILRSLIQQNGPYLLPAVVHDYLYWTQTCTRGQADSIFRLAMIENEVAPADREAIFAAVRAAGRFAWDANTEERSRRLIRVIPSQRLRIPPNTSWADYRRLLMDEEIAAGPATEISQAFCERGSMSVNDALDPD